MLISGRNSVREAFKSGVDIKQILVQDGAMPTESIQLLEELKKSNIRLKFTPKKIMDTKVPDKHQGFIAEVSDYKYFGLENVIKNIKEQGRQIFMVILDGISDPHNLGSIIRSCECAGVDCVVIDAHDACPVNSTVMKVSAGAINHLPVVRVSNINSTIKSLKQQGVWVYACELGGISMYDVDMRGDFAIVIGSEGKGVKRLTKELCDGVFTIPMFGKVNSLNASNATAISLYEALRQRKRNR